MSNEKSVTTTSNQEQSISTMGVFTSIEKFEESIRMAKALAASTLVPKEYQNNISNCMIAIDTAQRLRISPFATMQNLYIVNGRPSWSSQFIISAINKCDRFSEPLKFSIAGEGDKLECFAYTKDHNGNELKGPTISMKMAKEEGWLGKNGSKWKTMPQVMIQYRAASFFGRLHCPDILMGVYTDDENIERDPSTIIDISVKDVEKEVKEEIKEKANSKAIDIETHASNKENNKIIDVESTEVKVEQNVEEGPGF
ncbi:hypothetical protein [Clostridium tetani]|uniref:Recombinase RecT n=1 Tax=Clostridium tetani TaxID=1513 RepID=A0ABY0EV03_CLOTA|nr:hypothetical protein [Clostridium tetani]RXI58096.1 hypothetical protein DP131_03100 [Clostridium tetani]RXI66013.1 hypothetical protein DQN76_13995 [Clostridium tetani]